MERPDYQWGRVESDDVEQSSSLFGNLFRKNKRTTKDAFLGEMEVSTADDDVNITDSKTNLQMKQPRKLTPNLLKKFLPPWDKPSRLNVKVLMAPWEVEPAPGGGGSSHNRPLEIVVPESAIVVGDDAENGDTAPRATTQSRNRLPPHFPRICLPWIDSSSI